ncbi:hypothetical protein ANME2D_03145 [Candidatus Methanoperedens nitroreducens]|uniref:Uncharacterized protein n=1 Tax=Candidatus Methanoperedens nitratireducens TaxID=1392998 RepID=A0A062V3C3_9EURY|nr:hypothetical protein ANME2D_03145 [Candidatus Methanoperedens nitroreducens]
MTASASNPGAIGVGAGGGVTPKGGAPGGAASLDFTIIFKFSVASEPLFSRYISALIPTFSCAADSKIHVVQNNSAAL